MGTQICSTCKKSKELSEFSFKNKSKNIRSKKCKECTSEYSKAHYQKHQQIYIERAKKSKKKYAKRNTENVIEYLQDKYCSRCQIKDIEVLDFHHKDPNEKEYSVADMLTHGYSWKRIRKEIDKCEIVCANCHRKIHNRLKNAYRTNA